MNKGKEALGILHDSFAKKGWPLSSQTTKSLSRWNGGAMLVLRIDWCFPTGPNQWPQVQR